VKLDQRLDIFVYSVVAVLLLLQRAEDYFIHPSIFKITYPQTNPMTGSKCSLFRNSSPLLPRVLKVLSWRLLPLALEYIGIVVNSDGADG
jgi:hypothetical protein